MRSEKGHKADMPARRAAVKQAMLGTILQIAAHQQSSN
jgi:hypothetical protein